MAPIGGLALLLVGMICWIQCFRELRRVRRVGVGVDVEHAARPSFDHHCGWRAYGASQFAPVLLLSLESAQGGGE